MLRVITVAVLRCNLDSYRQHYVYLNIYSNYTLCFIFRNITSFGYSCQVISSFLLISNLGANVPQACGIVYLTIMI